jgi:hypothetical protein
MTRFSRRKFIAIAFAPILVGKGAASPPSTDYPLPSVHETPTLPLAPADALFGEHHECTECHGYALLTCPACDGTGMWTEASESAGLYQREAARHAGHCAWCEEGQVPCPECDGIGFTLSRGPYASSLVGLQCHR